MCTPILSSVTMTLKSLHTPLGSIYIVFYIYIDLVIVCITSTLQLLNHLMDMLQCLVCILCKQSVSEYIHYLKGAIMHVIGVTLQNYGLRPGPVIKFWGPVRMGPHGAPYY